MYVIADFKNRLEYKDAPIDKGKEIYEELFKERKLIYDESILEEAGIDINPFHKQIVGISEYSSEKPEGTKYSVQLNYVVEVPTKELPIKLSEEHTAYVWATRDSEYVDECIAEIIDAIEPQSEVGYARTKKM